MSETALFMTLFIGFGALSQWPLGWLSDKIDRRKVIMFCCAATAENLFEIDKDRWVLIALDAETRQRGL